MQHKSTVGPVLDDTKVVNLKTFNTSTSRLLITEESLCSVIDVKQNSLYHELDPVLVPECNDYESLMVELNTILDPLLKDHSKNRDLISHKLIEFGIHKGLTKTDSVLAVFANYDQKISLAAVQKIIQLFSKT